MPPTYRVLAVEDDELSYRLLKHVLNRLPLEIVNAATGAEAIAFLEQEMPDLIILDINLPDMRGWDVLDRFREDARLNRARVIVLTAETTPVHRLIGSLQAVAVYMTKPVGPDALRARVTELLGLDG